MNFYPQPCTVFADFCFISVTGVSVLHDRYKAEATDPQYLDIFFYCHLMCNIGISMHCI